MRLPLIALVLLAAVLLPAPLLIALTVATIFAVTTGAPAVVPRRVARSIRPAEPLIAVRLLRGPPR